MDPSPQLPQQTARIVLISGGTAMAASARVLKQYTNRSCHFLSPFDSGGSSAEFRHHFALPAMGDLRSRLIALADESSELHRQRAACLSQRMGANESQPLKTLQEWRNQAGALGQGEPIWDDLLETTVSFAKKLPADFNWSLASLGNLAMAAAMVEANLSLDSVTSHMHKLLRCQGQARCIVSDPLHLRVRLHSGRNVIGQHRITGKQHQTLNEAIDDLALCQDTDEGVPASCQIDDATSS
ncbi:MAG: 2-phospho-L-lactate transferase CofD family protein, partial [Oceanococcus sp.]